MISSILLVNHAMGEKNDVSMYIMHIQKKIL